MNRIGFLVNPVAGMGGAVGLKGTDGCVADARERGAVPVSPEKARRFLQGLIPGMHTLLTAGGVMGGDILETAGISGFRVIFQPASPDTTSADTRAACSAMIDAGVDIIVFCGGDGTARDVFSVTGTAVPILGIPAGVKIYSGVFALGPKSAARLFSSGAPLSFTDGEVMDVDEEQYRYGILSTRLSGIARTPADRTLCQSGKEVSFGDDSRHREEIARFIAEILRDDTLYLLGAGSTTGSISSVLDQPSSLLGVDALFRREVIATDLTESGILSLLDVYDRVKIILSPIGAQGFVLGRGNQQISSRVLTRTGTDALIVVATPEKLGRTGLLYLDTGDPALNARFDQTIQVVCGYRMARRLPVGTVC